MSNAPAGWYPVDDTSQRYWDGAAWTEHVAPLGAPQGPSVEPQPQPQPPGPTGQPGAGFPAGIGDPHDPSAASAQQNWGSPPAGIPYAANTPAAFHPDAPLASSADDRSMAVLCHVLGIFTGFVGPLIVWLVKKDTSPYVDMHGKAALNFQFSLIIYWLVSIVALIILIGFFMMLALGVVGIVLPIVAAVTANKGEGYKYPMTIPFFS